MFVLVTVNLPAVLCAVLIGWFAAISALAARAVAASVAAPVHTVRLMPALPHTTGRHRSGEVCRGPGRLANAASGARAPRAPHAPSDRLPCASAPPCSRAVAGTYYPAARGLCLQHTPTAGRMNGVSG